LSSSRLPASTNSLLAASISILAPGCYKGLSPHSHQVTPPRRAAREVAYIILWYLVVTPPVF
jgi:hypothetical protein